MGCHPCEVPRRLKVADGSEVETKNGLGVTNDFNGSVLLCQACWMPQPIGTFLAGLPNLRHFGGHRRVASAKAVNTIKSNWFAAFFGQKPRIWVSTFSEHFLVLRFQKSWNFSTSVPMKGQPPHALSLHPHWGSALQPAPDFRGPMGTHLTCWVGTSCYQIVGFVHGCGLKMWYQWWKNFEL